MAAPGITRLAGWWAIFAFFGFSLAPVLFLGGGWVGCILSQGLSALLWALPDGRSIHLLGNSLALAATVTVMASALGTGLALWTWGKGRWNRLVGLFYFIPFLIPLYIQILTWMTIAGRRQALSQFFVRLLGSEQAVFSAYGFGPAALVLTLATFPVVTLLVRSALQAIDPRLLDAAALFRKPWPVACHIIGPLITPAILSGAGLVFVLSLVEYGVPAMFEYNVYVMEIYTSFNQSFDPIKSFAISVPLIALAAVLLILSQSRLRNSPLRGRPGFLVELNVSAWPPPARALLILSLVTWLTAIAAPALVVLLHGSMPTTMADAVPPALHAIILTVAVAVASGAIVTLMAVPAAVVLTRRTGTAMLGWLLCAIPLAIPAPVTGIALIYLWNQPWLDWGYGTPFILVVAHVARLLPFGIYAAASQVRHIDPLLREAASLHPVGWLRRFLRVDAPLMAGAITTTALIAFVLSLGELGVSLLVAPPGEATLPIRIYNLLHYGATDTVCSLSLVMLAIATIAIVAFLAIQRRLSRWAI